jgi:hypothetical protein
MEFRNDIRQKKDGSTKNETHSAFILKQMREIKIYLKDIDDDALHFCILFIRTLSIVQFFNKITTFQRLALSPSSGDKRERAKREMILAGGSLRQS